MIARRMDGEAAADKILTMCFDCMVSAAGGVRLGNIEVREGRGRGEERRGKRGEELGGGWTGQKRREEERKRET